MNFKLKNPKGDKDSLILFYTNLPSGERFVYSTSEKIHPNNWDRSNQRPIKSRSPIDQSLRSSVELKLNRYKEYFQSVKYDLLAQELEQNKINYRKKFDKKFKNVVSREGFWDHYDKFCEINSVSNNWGKATCKRYINLKNHLTEFEALNGKIFFESIDLSWHSKFKSFCEGKGHQVNTYGRNLGLLKTFLNYSYQEGFTSKDTFKKFKVTREITPQQTLTMDEVKKLYEFQFPSARLERTRDLFVLSCLIGMRYSDFKRIKKENIEDGWIRIREVKDKSKILNVPLTPWAINIIEKYNYSLPVISEQKFRDYIKEIAIMAGFDQKLIVTKRIGNKTLDKIVKRGELFSTHTARRTFITIMKNKKVPDKAIMKITGHKSQSSFNSYYRPSDNQLTGFMNSVWSE